MNDLATVGGPAGSASNGGKNQDEYRLPTDVYPKHYALAIKTDLQALRFAGEALIDITAKASTSSLVFHLSKNVNVTHLALHTSELKSTSSSALPLESLSFDEERERATIDLKQTAGEGLRAGAEAKLWVRFEAELTGSMAGYYKSEGEAGEDGKKPVYALTQFEATAARKAFPCWDEPLVKSTFTVSLIARDDETVLANMPDVSSKPWKAPSNVSVEQVFADNYELGSHLDQVNTAGKTEGKIEGSKTESSTSDNWKITRFETTPLMSTYLVAFACGQFASLSSEHHSKLTGKTVPLKIFATPDLIKHAQFGLDIKKWALPVYEEVFDIPYALPKLDTLVAHDFDAGAMENWGLITGRTTAYIFDPEKSSLAAKKRVATVQCHELAHMWFGDIVTMKWWDNLWLNEAFATLMGELVIPDRIWPEWKPRQEFVEGHLQQALDLDSRRASHPIEVDCPDANQIAQIFDAISYSKGASVLRMLAGVVGEDKFLKGVSIYLKKHLYGNAETKDLWAGISEASGMDVSKFMANWTLKIGYPVITVEEKGDGKLKLTQNRFLASGDVKPEEDETLWWIPLEVKTSSGGKSTVDAKATLSERSATYDVGSTDEFKINADSIGVYRVNYSPERLAKLGQQAANFSVEDRVGLVSDASSLARAGYGKTSGSLSLITALGKTETEYLPWSQIATAVGKIVQVWWEQPEAVRNALDQIRIDLFKPIIQKLGYEHGADDAPDVKELRTLAISSCASANDSEVLAELKRRFTPFLEKNDDSLIYGDIQRAVLTNSVKHGGKAEWNKIREVYSKPPNPSTKVDAIYSLCLTKDEECLDKTFKMMDDGSCKDQDLYIFFAGLASNRISRKRIGEWFMENFDTLVKRYADGSMLPYLVKFAFNSLTSLDDLERVKAFFKDKDTRKFTLAVSQTYEAIEASANWVNRDQKDVEQCIMSTTMLQGVEKLLARSNEPLHLAAHHEEIQRRAFAPVGMNDSDPILARDPTNPILIKEAAAAQKEYFRKIKFARLEQQAKRSFVYGITADDPPKADPEVNEERRQSNVIKKAELKAVKDDIENMKVKAVETARTNTKTDFIEQATLTERMTEAQALYKQIKDMELEMQRMRTAHPVENRMTITQAEVLVEQYEKEMIDSTTEADEAKEEIEAVRVKAARAAKDVQRLAKDREREEARAREVREGREEGDTRVDELCHWLSSSIAFYKTLLAIRTVTAINETTVQLEYDIPNRNPITLLLEYDPLTRRLVEASVLGVDMDFKECIDLAVASNDVPGLVADILNRLRR